LVVAKSDSFLRKHASQRLDFVVVYVDLVGSTKMSTELTPDLLSKIITVFSQEVAYVIEHFHGLVLKFIGDEVIGYFPFADRSFGDIVLCGKAVIDVVQEAINPLLLQMGHNGIAVKVTLDLGQHTIVRYGSDLQRSHIDIISATMNLAAKMQSVTMGGQMVIGKNLYEKLDGRWQRMFSMAKLAKSKWSYHNLAESTPYQLYASTF